MPISVAQVVDCETTDATDTDLVATWTSTPDIDNYAVLLVAVNENMGLRTLTTPTGWDVLIAKYNPGGNHQSVAAYGREITGTTDDTPTVVASAAGHMGGFLIELHGVDTTASIPEVSATAGDSATATAWLGGTTAITTTPAALGIAFFAAKNIGQVISAPTDGFTIEDNGTTELGTAPVDNDRLTYHWLSKQLSSLTDLNPDVTSSLFRRYSSLTFAIPAAITPTPESIPVYFRTTSDTWVT